MTLNELQKFLDGEYFNYSSGLERVCLDGWFTLEQLKIVVEFLENQK